MTQSQEMKAYRLTGVLVQTTILPEPSSQTMDIIIPAFPSPDLTALGNAYNQTVLPGGWVRAKIILLEQLQDHNKLMVFFKNRKPHDLTQAKL